MVSFLHTADWQIGKQFANISGDASAFLRNQRIETVKKIAALATERKVDAVLVAGDVFETNLVNGQTIFKTLVAMADGFEGYWILLPGNHDSAEPNSIWMRFKKICVSKNIIILDSAEPLFLKELKTVILPAPLQRRHDMRDLTGWFDDFSCDEELIRIGLAHGSVDNRLNHRGEANNTISDTRTKTANLDYLALGDWHGTLEIAERTWYSGTPEPDRFKANDAGNILHVEIAERDAPPVVTKIPIGHYKWCQIEQKIYTASDVDSFEHNLKNGKEVDQTLVRACLTGAVSFETKLYLEQVLEKLSASLFYIEVDETGLTAEPTNSDLEEMDQSGYVRNAVQKLLTLKDDESNSDRELARLALQILYTERRKLESQCR